MSRKVYFARSIDLYDSLIDKEYIKGLSDLGFEVVDPNKFFTKEEYDEKGMDMFFERIKDCDLFVYMLNIDGNMTAGACKEYRYAFDNDILCLQVPYFSNIKILNVEQTRNYLKQVGAR